ncbi:hypothetical protein K440DRAFT_644962 [Wilcoxina mikolae CBS 423.85]|nr:hypothetical protein K440DRAFT_644962 [Wilcoxina mikolae CBS 423.85]
MTAVQRWHELLAVVRRIYPESEEPQIVTFNGDLILSENVYIRVLKPNLHIMVSYPSTIDDLAVELGKLLPFERDCPYSDNVDSLISEGVRDQASSGASTHDSPSDGEQKVYQLQPPTLTFYPPEEVQFDITLVNGSFPDTAGSSPSNLHTSTSLYATGKRRQKVGPNNNYIPQHSSSEGVGSATAIRGEGDIYIDMESLPNWYPFGIYSKNLAANDGKPITATDTKNRLVTEKAFPTSSFVARPERRTKQVISSINWKFTASPVDTGAAILTDAVSKRTRKTLDWAIYPEPQMTRESPKSSERRVYANCDEMSDEEGKGQGWWMANVALLPASFSGKEGDRTFLLRGIAQAEYFLAGFLTSCGIPKMELTEFVTYWIRNLSPTESMPPEDYLIIVKFLTPMELDILLPLHINPVPNRLIRVFPVFRVLTQEELLSEKIVVRGIYDKEVGVVTKGMGFCRGGLSCGHGGPLGGCVKVFEIGGARVFGSIDDATRTPVLREQTPGLVVGDETIEVWSGTRDI